MLDTCTIACWTHVQQRVGHTYHARADVGEAALGVREGARHVRHVLRLVLLLVKHASLCVSKCVSNTRFASARVCSTPTWRLLACYVPEEVRLRSPGRGTTCGPRPPTCPPPGETRAGLRQQVCVRYSIRVSKGVPDTHRVTSSVSCP